MILDPINDVECLGQLTQYARELYGTTLVRAVAMHLGSRQAVIEWFQGLPQADDFGDEKVRVIQCDVPQRTRLFPDDPNCVERSFGALMLLEILDPKTPRALATVDKPLRHTGLVENVAGSWKAVDLFPRRNATTRNFDWKALLVGAEEKGLRPVAKLYLGDAGAKAIDFGVAQQNKLIGIKKPNAPEKQPTPPPASSAQRVGGSSVVTTGPPSTQSAAVSVGALPSRAGAHPTDQQSGETDEETYPITRDATGFAAGRAGGDAQTEAATEGDDHGPHNASAIAQRFWSTFGR